MRIISRSIKWLVAIALLLIVATAVILPRQSYIFKNLAERLTLAQGEHILLLGRPGPGYDGAENTDSIILLSRRGDQAALIYVPRDLLVSVRGETYKINSLFPLGFRSELLTEVSRLTGLSVHYYIAYDLQLVRRLINAMGGINVNLPAPVVDAVSGYTLGRGRHHVDGDWAEFVIRSRYAPDGDFFRMRSQFAIVRGIHDRLGQLSSAQVVQLIRVFEGSGRDYETNLSSLELLNFFSQLRRVDFSQVRAVILGFNSGLWRDGSFPLALGAGAHGHAYGLMPRDGLGHYGSVQQYIRTELMSANQPSSVGSIAPTRDWIKTDTITPIVPTVATTAANNINPSLATSSAATVDWLGGPPSFNTNTLKR